MGTIIDRVKEIPFNRSMNIDKRHPGFCYLREGVHNTRTRGLYPGAKFEEIDYNNRIVDGDDILDILGGDSDDIYLIVARGNDVKILRYSSINNDLGFGNSDIDDVDYECGAFGSDGSFIVTDDDKVRRLDGSGAAEEIGTISDARPRIAFFDGLYYFYLSDTEIYRQLDHDDTVTTVFNDLGINPEMAVNYNDQMVILGDDQSGPDGFIVLFWDKSDADLFDKRIEIQGHPIALGNIDGTLQLIYSTPDTQNTSQFHGRIIVSHYDGEKFVEVNSIKAGDNNVSFNTGSNHTFRTRNNEMIFGISSNDYQGSGFDRNNELYRTFILRTDKFGNLDVLTATPNNDDVSSIVFDREFILYSTDDIRGGSPKILRNEFNLTDNECTHITNFLNRTYNRHKLQFIGLSFEKLFRRTNVDDNGVPTSGEICQVLYRTSEREQFTHLDLSLIHI